MWFIIWLENGVLNFRRQGDKAEAKYWQDAFIRENKPCGIIKTVGELGLITFGFRSHDELPKPDANLQPWDDIDTHGRQ